MHTNDFPRRRPYLLSASKWALCFDWPHRRATDFPGRAEFRFTTSALFALCFFCLFFVFFFFVHFSKATLQSSRSRFYSTSRYLQVALLVFVLSLCERISFRGREFFFLSFFEAERKFKSTQKMRRVMAGWLSQINWTAV